MRWCLFPSSLLSKSNPPLSPFCYRYDFRLRGDREDSKTEAERHKRRTCINFGFKSITYTFFYYYQLLTTPGITLYVRWHHVILYLCCMSSCSPLLKKEHFCHLATLHTVHTLLPYSVYRISKQKTRCTNRISPKSIKYPPHKLYLCTEHVLWNRIPTVLYCRYLSVHFLTLLLYCMSA